MNTESFVLNLGPFHPSLPEKGIGIRIGLSGERIAWSQVETGYFHRGLEKVMEQLSWPLLIPYAARLEPEASVFGELVLCLAVEELCTIEVPLRAQSIRIMVSELARISSHLKLIRNFARAVESDTLEHYVLRDRERILDLFELLSGARFALGFLRFGGVAGDVSEGFLERVLGVCKLIRSRILEYNKTLSYHVGFEGRTRRVGPLSLNAIRRFGITGPVARASGSTFDVRRAHPYCGYEAIDFKVIAETSTQEHGGDSHDRYLTHLHEIRESLEIVEQVADHLPREGGCISKKTESGIRFPRGESIGRVESPRGLLSCVIISDGGPKPLRVQFATPSLSLVHAIPTLLEGMLIEDLSVGLASLNFSTAEVDR